MLIERLTQRLTALKPPAEQWLTQKNLTLLIRLCCSYFEDKCNRRVIKYKKSWIIIHLLAYLCLCDVYHLVMICHIKS